MSDCSSGCGHEVAAEQLFCQGSSREKPSYSLLVVSCPLVCEHPHTAHSHWIWKTQTSFKIYLYVFSLRPLTFPLLKMCLFCRTTVSLTCMKCGSETGTLQWEWPAFKMLWGRGGEEEEGVQTERQAASPSSVGSGVQPGPDRPTTCCRWVKSVCLSRARAHLSHSLWLGCMASCACTCRCSGWVFVSRVGWFEGKVGETCSCSCPGW